MYRIHWTGTKMIYAAGGLFWGFTQEIHHAVLGLFVLLCIDTVTGFIAAPYRGQKRTSRKLSRFVQKIITYTIAVFSAFVAEKMTFPSYAQGVELAYWVALAIDGVELLSIFENLYDITGLKVFSVLTQLSFKKISEKIGMEVKPSDVRNRRANKQKTVS
ncbi:MAG: phage holin family protein [Alphaproteobacteria bacterium]|nr:phage holin family protein [Alphaproteobacteria bacterium]MBO7066570.1 phage holin family protein [Alphaproteobacteria bacterium]